MSTRILVTGGTGVLGQELVPRLVSRGCVVRVMSRRPPEVNPWPNVEWAQADLRTGIGLRDALSDVQIVVHAASDSAMNTRQGVRFTGLFRQSKAVDVDGTRRLLDGAARETYFFYTSIIGVDQLPTSYFRYKREAEALVAGSGLRWAVLRIAQFYTLLEGMLENLAHWPVMLLPTNLSMRPIAPADAAEWISLNVCKESQGRLPDLCGPELYEMGDLVRSLVTARGLHRRLIGIPLPGVLAKTLSQGYVACPHGYGQITWADWLRHRTGPQ